MSESDSSAVHRSQFAKEGGGAASIVAGGDRNSLIAPLKFVRFEAVNHDWVLNTPLTRLVRALDADADSLLEGV